MTPSCTPPAEGWSPHAADHASTGVKILTRLRTDVAASPIDEHKHGCGPLAIPGVGYARTILMGRMTSALAMRRAPDRVSRVPREPWPASPTARLRQDPGQQDGAGDPLRDLPEIGLGDEVKENRARCNGGRQLMFVEDAARCAWICWTAIAPSPTAEATRFTEPWRTSPTANTLGRLD
jgi:hypothetical protein